MRRYRFWSTFAAAAVVIGLATPPTPPSLSGSDTAGPPAAASPSAEEVELPLPPSQPRVETPPRPTPTAAPPAGDRLPQLPERVIAARPTHVVPEDVLPPPPRPVSIGRAPGLAEPPPRIAAREAPRKTAGARAAAIQIAGAAEPVGAVRLRINGEELRLFGVRTPEGGDRCAASALGAKPLPCAEQAGKLLSARLARNPAVSCRIPAPAGAAHAAICLDAEGVDLGGLLVAEGLALADPSQGDDYVGAEAVARSNRRGLWLYR
ncbi:MAG TPA: hypothetical protein VFA50_16990 [Stellaceae bacterium]|nr:hypothetical protein [Stellaceae bacterium]